MNNGANETDLTCPKCEGRGFISGLSGCSGFGDPEEEYVTEECSCFAGTLRCGCCGREEAVAIVADGTADGMPVGERCRRERAEKLARPGPGVAGGRCRDSGRVGARCSVSAPAASCRACGYVQRPGENWGHLVGLEWVDVCKHVSGQRRCDCCTRDWYAEGSDSTWDCDGCAHEDCPGCVTADGAEVAA